MNLPGNLDPARNSAIYSLLQMRESEQRPIRVGVIGAGATSRAIALQLGTPVAGMRLAGISNRTPEHAERAFKEAAIANWKTADTAEQAAAHIARGTPVLTDDPTVLTRCDAVDLIVEVTGTVDFGASVVLDAFKHRKPVVLVNAELDSLIGPILKTKADKAGVVLTHTDGDEPGVAMTLFRYLQSVGLRPVAAGNIKGMVDYYRTPDTQREFAARNDQDVKKVTSFADATKLSMETTVLANATGFSVARRGMVGPACGYVRELAKLLPAEAMLERWNRGLLRRRGTAHRRLRRRPRGKSAQEDTARVLQARRWSVLCLLYAVSSAPHPVAIHDRSCCSALRPDCHSTCGAIVRSSHHCETFVESG